MENNFSAALLVDTGFRADSQGARIRVRLPWYRSLPMSVIEVFSLKIDDRVIPAAAITIEINGRQLPATQLGELVDEWWYVLDDAILNVSAPGLPPAAQHKVELTLNVYPPYIPGLTWATQSSRLLTAQ
jgi:hypothetical protein